MSKRGTSSSLSRKETGVRPELLLDDDIYKTLIFLFIVLIFSLSVDSDVSLLFNNKVTLKFSGLKSSERKIVNT